MTLSSLPPEPTSKPRVQAALRRLRPLSALVAVGSVVAACGGDGSETASGPGKVSAGGAAGRAGASGAAGGMTGIGRGGADAGASGGASGNGGTAGKSGASGQGPAGSAGSPLAGCNADADCPALATIPPDCAKATCDEKTRKCVYASKDADGDKAPSGRCAALDGVTSVVIGQDCDDTNPNVRPGGWDGPEGEGHPNGCGDGLDQDCSGVDDDQKLADGTTCTCSPGDTQDCSLDASGKPVVFPGGKPRGICAYGHQTCVDSGKWGPCVDTVAPNVEVCDPSGKEDEDCDGLVDDADPNVLGKKTWFCDADSDSFLAPNVVGVDSCQQPPKEGCAGKWVTSGQKTDCDDSPKDGAATFPGAKEICDGVRNDCDPTKQPDEGAIAIATWLRDDDGDGHVLAPNIGLPQKKIQCARPGSTAADCPAGKTTCTELWLREGQGTADDCDDGNADRYPGNWDGPATTQAGLDDAGATLELFQRTEAQYTNTGGTWTTPFLQASDVPVATQTGVPALAFDWAKGRPDTAMGYDWFQARVTGTLVVVAPGDYTFSLDKIDDGARLWIGDKGATTPIIDQWRFPAEAAGLVATVTLAAGSYPLTLEYLEVNGPAYVTLDWSGPDFTRRVLRVKDPLPLGTKPNRCGDNVDQDCDGNPDNGLSQAQGSVRGCTAAVCEPGSVRPCAAEGSVQNNVGECRLGRQRCSGDGAGWGICVDQVDPAVELCGDGKDNDCNGNVDDGQAEYCPDLDEDGFCNLGACQTLCPSAVPAKWKNRASQCKAQSDCAGNRGLDDDRDINPLASEVCDGKDNNCSAGADEGNPGGGSSCPTGRPGVCSAGTLACQGGGLQCVQQTPSSSEICDGKDNNCDGAVDNGPMPGVEAHCDKGSGLGACRCGYSRCRNGGPQCDNILVPGDQPSVQSSPHVCPAPSGLPATWDWNCNGSEEPEVNLTPYAADASTFCLTRPPGSCGGPYYVYQTGGGIAPYPGCGVSYREVRCIQSGSVCFNLIVSNPLTVKCK